MVNEDAERQKQLFARRHELVKRLYVANVALLAGTDLANPYLYPGFSLHDELALLVEAGLPPLAALQAATLNPAKLLKQNELGSIEKSKRADLVLLEANPLENIRNTQRIRAVIAGGRVFDRGTLDKLLEQAKVLAQGE
jgi:imidazolonepropionase-like amidohydrolase